MNLRLAITATALVFGLQGCGGKTTKEDIDLLKNLQTSQALWQSTDIDDYKFTLNRNCFCIPAGDISIQVEDGEVTSAWSQLEDRELTAEELGYFPATVPALFEWMQEAIIETEQSIEIEYDEELGFPVRVAIDEDQLVSDQGLVLTLSDFETE